MKHRIALVALVVAALAGCGSKKPPAAPGEAAGSGSAAGSGGAFGGASYGGMGYGGKR